jgi:hypothetical protein
MPLDADDMRKIANLLNRVSAEFSKSVTVFVSESLDHFHDTRVAELAARLDEIETEMRRRRE